MEPKLVSSPILHFVSISMDFEAFPGFLRTEYTYLVYILETMLSMKVRDFKICRRRKSASSFESPGYIACLETWVLSRAFGEKRMHFAT